MWKKDWGAQAILVGSLLRGKIQLSDQPERLRGNGPTLYRAEPIEYRGRTRKYPWKPVKCVNTWEEPVEKDTGETRRRKYQGKPQEIPGEPVEKATVGTRRRRYRGTRKERKEMPEVH